MKKILFVGALGICSVVGPRIAFADDTLPPIPPTVSYPTTAQHAYLANQIILTIINHGSFSEEFQRGRKQVILSDNVIEAGHVAGQYALALDASIYQDPTKIWPSEEAGIRLNLHSLLNKHVTFTPEWQTVLGNLEYYPRVGFDFGQNYNHGWFATFNLGYGFGPGGGVTTLP